MSIEAPLPNPERERGKQAVRDTLVARAGIFGVDVAGGVAVASSEAFQTNWFLTFLAGVVMSEFARAELQKVNSALRSSPPFPDDRTIFEIVADARRTGVVQKSPRKIFYKTHPRGRGRRVR